MPAGLTGSAAAENIFNLSAQNLKNWRKARAGVLSGTGNARVIFVGDSTTFGGNSAGAWITPNITAATAAALNAAGIAATDNSICGSSVQNITTGSRLGTDPRFTAGAWLSSYVDGNGTLGGSLFASISGSPLQFTPLQPVDTFNLFWYAYGSNGSITMKAGSGSTVTIAANQSGNMTTTTATGPLGTLTLGLTYVSGNPCFCAGIEAYNSAVKSINIMNGGWYGSASGSWSAAADPYNTVPMLQYLAPALTVITPGINDWNNGIAVATFTANIQAVITAAKLSGDVILMTPAPNDTNTALQASYMTALYALAAANNCVLVDNWSRWGSYTAGNALGFYSDTIHPDAAGYADQVSLLREVLLHA